MVAIPISSFGLAFVDYKERGASTKNFKTLFEFYVKSTVESLLSQGNFH